MFDSIINIGVHLQRLNEKKIIREVVETSSIQSQMIDMNQEQLQSGYDAEDKATGNYSKTSVNVYGKEPGAITLYDTGEFYDSMRIITKAENFYVYAKTLKPSRDLLDRWPNALGLTDDNLSDIIPEITERIIEKIYETL